MLLPVKVGKGRLSEQTRECYEGMKKLCKIIHNHLQPSVYSSVWVCNKIVDKKNDSEKSKNIIQCSPWKSHLIGKSAMQYLSTSWSSYFEGALRVGFQTWFEDWDQTIFLILSDRVTRGAGHHIYIFQKTSSNFFSTTLKLHSMIFEISTQFWSKIV